MNDDYDKIEEDLKEKSDVKKKQKVSGRSVFKLKEIIQQKAIPSDKGNDKLENNED